jgi:hypothetical protein
MDRTTPTKILRLSAMETRAEARYERALQSGNTRWAMRTANFWTLVSSRSTATCLGEISTYSD